MPKIQYAIKEDMEKIKEKINNILRNMEKGEEYSLEEIIHEI